MNAAPTEFGGDRFLTGPDLEGQLAIGEVIASLDDIQHDPEGYAQLWVIAVQAVGTVDLRIERDGDAVIWTGFAADAQDRERAVRMNALSAHLRASGRRDAVSLLLQARCLVFDDRDNEPRETTRSVRGYIATGGRIMLDPDGHVRVGGGARAFLHGSATEAAEVLRADRAFELVRCRWRSVPQIERAVRMLGTPTHNGWIVLEGAKA